VVAGDWIEVMPERGPFDLLFFDGGGRDALQPTNWQTIANLLKPAGIMVIDDLTPEENWPEEWRGKPDPKRVLAFRSGLFTATEVRSRADSTVLLLVKQQDMS
jgi:predicted O-methyltransferase YrrM